MTDLPKVPLDVRVFEGHEAAGVIIDFKDALRAERSRVNSYRNLLHSPDDQPSFEREYAYLKSIEVAA